MCSMQHHHDNTLDKRPNQNKAGTNHAHDNHVEGTRKKSQGLRRHDTHVFLLLQGNFRLKVPPIS